MRVDLFDFKLPDGFIARRPVVPRDAARLLVVGDGHEDKRFCDLPEWLRDGDVLVLNDTRVIPSRLAGRREADRGTAKVEVTLLQEIRGAGEIGQWAVQWHALARPAKRLRSGDTLDLGNGLAAEVVSRGDGGEVCSGSRRNAMRCYPCWKYRGACRSRPISAARPMSGTIGTTRRSSRADRVRWPRQPRRFTSRRS